MYSFSNRTFLRTAVAVTAFLTAFSLIGAAQRKAHATRLSKQDTARAIVIKSYKEKAVDGLMVKLVDRKGNPVDPGTSFRSGDELKITLISNFGGHVYFVNVTPGGKTRVFWHTKVEADEEYTLPQGKDVISFDNEKGTEIFKVVLSPERVDAYETALRNTNGELGQTAESVAAELGGGAKSDSKDKGKDKKDKNKGKEQAKAAKAENAAKAAPGEAVGIVQPQAESGARCRGLGFDADPKIRCRGLSFAPENKEKGTVVAISDKQGKMKAGDVAVFELRLKHI